MNTPEQIDGIRKQFVYYKQLGEKTFGQLDDHQLFEQPDTSGNSIPILVKHLWGNMKSRWTDFLTTDGEKSWRDREGEFEGDIKTRQEMLNKWNEGWECLFTAIDSITTENIDQLVYIRNQGHTIMEAVYRQLAHYAYHVGQIVFIGKWLAGNKWQSLSIPKGGSESFNTAKFAEEKKRGHFTDDFLNK